MRKTWLWTLVTVLSLAALSYLLYTQLSPSPLPAGVLYGNGHIEGIEVQVSSEIAGRVVDNRLVEGKRVNAADLLIRLDDAEIRTRLAQAQAEEAAITQEQVTLMEQIRTWQHHLRTAKNDLERYRKLSKAGYGSPQNLEQAENRLHEASGQVGTLEAQLSQTGARLEAARKQIELLRLQLGKAEILAPIPGTILLKGIETGELAMPGRVIAVLVDMTRLELKVYIPEKDIGKIKLGDSALVRVNAFPERYFEGRVIHVDQQAQFTPRDVHMPEERVRMVFGIKLALANPEGYLKPGMPADAWIRWDESKAWPERLPIPR